MRDRRSAFRISGDAPFSGIECILSERILRNRSVHMIRDVMFFPDSERDRTRHHLEPLASQFHMLGRYLAKLLGKNGRQRQVFTVFCELPDFPM